MAQAGSVQREPSMEEILASIRRIIEDNDSPRHAKPAPAVVIPDNLLDDLDLDEIIAEPEVETFRKELAEAPVATIRTLDDSLLRQERETGSIVAEPKEQKPPRPVPGPPQPASQARPVNGHAPLMPVPPRATPIPVPEPANDTRAALVSDRSGRQVAASLGELSEAFAASRRRSFDEMAEEMLRPMLHDWLDNNLPQLVERLVREEIERIARGAAR